MKINQKGFTVLEIILLLVIVGALCGVVGYVVSSKKNDDKKETSSNSQTTQTTQVTPEARELINYDHPVVITKKSDTDKLIDASDSFKKYMATLVGDTTVQEANCPNPTGYSVMTIYKDEFAHGGVSECIGGAAQIWKKTNGKWDRVWGGQQIISCEDVKKESIPKEISAECIDEANAVIANTN